MQVSTFNSRSQNVSFKSNTEQNKQLNRYVMGVMNFCLAIKLRLLRVLLHAKTVHVCLTKYCECILLVNVLSSLTGSNK